MQTPELIDLLLKRHNVLLAGPPGTGKTFSVGGIADHWESQTNRPLGGNGSGEWAMSFHASTSYEDFVEGIRPSGEAFAVKPGFFRRIVTAALRSPHQDFLILLDELNRANVARVLGDLLTVLKSEDRCKINSPEADDINGDVVLAQTSGGQSVTLPYSGEVLVVPDNIYIVATMNTTDRSIVDLGGALKRRFADVVQSPLDPEELNVELTRRFSSEAMVALEPSIAVWHALNQHTVGPIFNNHRLLGHSYFFDAARDFQAESNVSLPPVHSFWIQNGNPTSGAGNQFDLSKSGFADKSRGSVHLFLPSLTDISPGRKVTHNIEVEWNGSVYHDCHITYYGEGKKPNKSWRLLLNGTTDANVKFDPAGLEQQILVFERVAPLSFRLTVFSPAMVERLRNVGWHDLVPASRREYGSVDALEGGVVDRGAATVQRMWRHDLLPQLIAIAQDDNAAALLAADMRLDYLRNIGLTDLAWNNAQQSLKALDDLLDRLHLILEPSGVGLARTISVAVAEHAGRSEVASEASVPAEHETQENPDLSSETSDTNDTSFSQPDGRELNDPILKS